MCTNSVCGAFIPPPTELSKQAIFIFDNAYTVNDFPHSTPMEDKLPWVSLTSEVFEVLIIK